jgi:hypothetical protein
MKEVPIFILFLNTSTINNSRYREYVESVDTYIRDSIGKNFKVLLIPILDGLTRVQIFYPSGSPNKQEFDDLLSELAKRTAFKNIRIRFDK